MEGMFEKCGSAISDDCKGTTVPMTVDGWKTAANEMTNAAGFLIQGVVAGMGADLSFNLLQALNSLRCAILSLGMNLWQFFAAVYYFSVEAGFDKEILKYVDEYYPYVCTCQAETDVFAKLLKATADTLVVMSGCSAAAQKAALARSEKNNSS